MNKRDLMIATALVLALGACRGESAADADLAEVNASMAQQQSPEAAAPAPAVPVATQPAVAAPVMLSADAVVVGSVVAPNGAMVAPKAVFGAGDTVYASVATAGSAPGAEVVAYWFGADGGSVKQERKPVGPGAEHVSFSLSRADGMKAGSFMVQVDVAGKPVGMADFSVH